MKLLLVGDYNSQHLKNLIKHLKRVDVDNEITIDVYSRELVVNNDSNCDLVLNNLFTKKKHFPTSFYKIFLLSKIFNIIDTYVSFYSIMRRRYDVVNIHFFSRESYLLFPIYKLISKKILISPWGSDVYRSGKLYIRCQKFLYKHADFVSTSKTKFSEDVIAYYGLRSEQLVEAEFGSEIIEEIINLSHISKEDAKKYFSLSDRYIITCGYNGNEAQNHVAILNSIKQIKDKLPKNTTIILPFTYGYRQEYKDKIKCIVSNIDIEYKIFNKFMPLRDTAMLRKCTDVFVHVQSTDAFSASIQEYIISNAKVINGKWLRYPSLEKTGIPYFIVDDLIELPNTILSVIDSEPKLISAELRQSINNRSWSKCIQNWFSFYTRFN